MLEIAKLPLMMVYIACLSLMPELKIKKQKVSLLICAMFLGALIAL